MPGCDMCGKDYGELVDAIVEGSMMKICLDCSKHGSVIPVNQAVVDKKVERKKDLEEVSFVDIITDDYAEIIKTELAYAEDTVLICGMALGYEDKEALVNSYRTSREDVSSFTKYFL